MFSPWKTSKYILLLILSLKCLLFNIPICLSPMSISECSLQFRHMFRCPVHFFIIFDVTTTCFDIVFCCKKFWSTTVLLFLLPCQYDCNISSWSSFSALFKYFFVSPNGKNLLLVWSCRLCSDSRDLVFTNCQFWYYLTLR